MTLQSTLWIIHPLPDLYTFRNAHGFVKARASFPQVGNRMNIHLSSASISGWYVVPSLIPERSFLKWYGDLWLNGYYPPPPKKKNPTYSGEEGTGYCNKLAIWRGGEKRKLSVVAGTTGIAGNPRLGQPVWQHPAPLVCVQCEALPWSLSSTAARGGTGTGRVPLRALLGASGVLPGVEEP